MDQPSKIPVAALLDQDARVKINGIGYYTAAHLLHDPTPEELNACISAMAAGLPSTQVLGNFLAGRRKKLLS